jgi:hypothetical protein
MRGNTEDASKAIFLLKFNVPYWALAYVFGRDHMFWYRLAGVYEEMHKRMLKIL